MLLGPERRFWGILAVDFRSVARYTAGMSESGEELSWLTFAVVFIAATAGCPLLIMLLLWLVTLFV